MAYSRFSHRLTVLMRKRKISGQKIGDMVGKSQKTISRYANGEVDPSNEIKNQIYAAIAELSGIEEDGLSEEELELREFLRKDWGYENSDCEWVPYEYGVSEIDIENARRVESLSSDFDELSTQEKKYYLENFFLFHCTNDRDYELVEKFHLLTDKKQRELISFLENFNFSFDDLKGEEKMPALLQLVRKSVERPIDIKEVTLEPKNDEIMRNRFEENIHEILREAIMGNVPYHPVFLKYTPMDWYFLLRVLIFEFRDMGKCDSDGLESDYPTKIYGILRMYREEGNK